MRRYLFCAASVGVALAAAACSPDTEPAATSTSEETSAATSVTATPSADSAAPASPARPAPGEVGVSAGGVTTAVGAPAESTEDDYFQACRAAKTWMDERGGDPATQIEPYLGTLQSAQSVGPGTFDKRWADLSPGQQSAVIVAVEAAADALCG